MTHDQSPWKRFSQRYVRFIEGQGFVIIIAICVCIIAGTAVWTNQTNSSSPPAPTLPLGGAASAAQLQQQALKDAVTKPPTPTEAPVIWSAPLSTISVLRSFQAARLTQSAVSRVWQLHDAVDLRCSAGESIHSMADGTVVSAVSEGLMGASITIDHGHGIVAEYAGMALHAGLRPGDPIAAEQTLGFAGNNVMDETDLGTHLHLRVTQNGNAIDPLTLLK